MTFAFGVPPKARQKAIDMYELRIGCHEPVPKIIVESALHVGISTADLVPDASCEQGTRLRNIWTGQPGQPVKVWGMLEFFNRLSYGVDFDVIAVEDIRRWIPSKGFRKATQCAWQQDIIRVQPGKQLSPAASEPLDYGSCLTTIRL